MQKKKARKHAEKEKKPYYPRGLSLRQAIGAGKAAHRPPFLLQCELFRHKRLESEIKAEKKRILKPARPHHRGGGAAPEHVG